MHGMILLEFGLMSGMAATFGVLLSMAMSYTLSWQIFENLWHPAWWISILAIVAVTVLGMGVALLATFRILRLKPLGLLQEG